MKKYLLAIAMLAISTFAMSGTSVRNSEEVKTRIETVVFGKGNDLVRSPIPYELEAYLYITELKIIHPNKSEELDVLKVSLEGFQYIDPETDNGQYAKSVVTLIEDSNINPDSKNALISGVSVANASVRLWNEDAINSL